MSDEISQREKRKILAEDRERISTYLSHAEASAQDDRGGRFSVRSPTTVTGTSPTHQYPRLPLTAPSNQMAQMPPEPSLGYSVNDQECVGEFHERGDAAAPASDGGLRRRGWRRL
jgi:hypothetical protein